MAKFYRGDTLPVVVSFDNYKFQPGDKVTVGVFGPNCEKFAEKTIEVVGECDEVQIELSREEMYDAEGECIIEARTVTNANMEMTIQKNIDLRRDCIR